MNLVAPIAQSFRGAIKNPLGAASKLPLFMG